MVWIDIICSVVIVILALLGLWRGFFKSFFRLCAWIAALLGAYFATDFFGNFIANNLDTDGFTVKVICICIGFLIPFLLLSFVGHLIHNAIKDTAISGINRLLGAALGIVKALIICFVFLTIIHLIPASGDLKETRNNSVSYNVYKWSLETMGFSSEEVDLIDMAEKKSAEIADSAIEASKAAVENEVGKAVDNAKEATKNAAKDAIEKAVKSDSSAKEAKDTLPTVKDSSKVDSLTKVESKPKQ